MDSYFWKILKYLFIARLRCLQFLPLLRLIAQSTSRLLTSVRFRKGFDDGISLEFKKPIRHLAQPSQWGCVIKHVNHKFFWSIALNQKNTFQKKTNKN